MKSTRDITSPPSSHPTTSSPKQENVITGWVSLRREDLCWPDTEASGL